MMKLDKNAMNNKVKYLCSPLTCHVGQVESKTLLKYISIGADELAEAAASYTF